MWHSFNAAMEETERSTEIASSSMERSTEITSSSMDILSIHKPFAKQEVPPETATMSRIEHYSEAIQTMGLAPKVLLTNESNVLQLQNFDADSRPVVQRQESDVTIDKRRQAKRVAPPEVNSQEAVDPGCEAHLNVRRKVSYKRMRKDEEKPYESLSQDIGQLNIGFKEPPKPVPSPEERKIMQAQKMGAAHKLITDINKACPGKQLQSVASRKVLFDESIDWCDLHHPVERKYVGNGTFGTVLSLKTKHGRRIIQKVLVPNLQELTHPNEVLVPLSFPNCDSITPVLAISWDGKKASIFQESAGESLRELMQKPEKRKFLQEGINPWKVMQGVLKGLSTLHSCGIKHRDVKPENTCYDTETGQVRLIDYASCRTPQDEETGSTRGTTPEYLPPTVSYCILKKLGMPPLTEKSDVWGAGMIALYIIKGGHPPILFFTGNPEYPQSKDAESIRVNLVLSQLAQFRDELPPWFLDNGDEDMKILLRGCLSLHEEKRWTSSQALRFVEAKLKKETVARSLKKLVSLPEVDNNPSKSKIFGGGDLGINLNFKKDRLDYPALATHTTNGAPGGVVTGFVLRQPAVNTTTPVQPHIVGTGRVVQPDRIGTAFAGQRPVIGIAPTMQRSVVGNTSALHHLPSRSQLFTTATPRVQALPAPSEIGLVQTAQPVSPLEEDMDEDLAWLQNTVTAKRSVPVPQGSSSTVSSTSPQVMGLWGQVSPQVQHQSEVIGRGRVSAPQDLGPQGMQGNIPNFLFESD